MGMGLHWQGRGTHMPNALEKRFEAARFNANIVKPVAPESVWEKRISNQVAYALLMYTGLQIFVVMQAIRGEGASILPYMGLVALVGIVIRCAAAWKSAGSGWRAAALPRTPCFLPIGAIAWASGCSPSAFPSVSLLFSRACSR